MRISCRLTFIITALTALVTAGAAAKPLKVYILAGQSNMQGKARPSTLPAMAKDLNSKALHDKMVGPDGEPRVLTNVYVAAVSSRWGQETTTNGPLTIGYGHNLYGNNTAFGTELAFGITLYEHLQEPILIIKASWGGKDLNTDFRPPSAGPFYPDPSKVEDHKGNRGIIPASQLIAGKKKKTHVYYNKMMEFAKTVLADIGSYHPAYDPEQGYEIAGFVWFQGYNDIIQKGYYTEPEGKTPYAKYSTLMAQFIRDVRKDLNAPAIPFVIGVMGIDGKTEGDFQAAQAAPAEMPEFKDTVMAVLTGKYWDKQLGELDQRMLRRVTKPFGRQKRGLSEDEAQALKQKLINENFTDEELKRLETEQSNAAFHYLGSAKIYSLIGEAFAEALLEWKRN